MEILKKILGEELYNKLIEPLEQDVKDNIASELQGKEIILPEEGQFIPKEKFDQKNEENKSYKTKIAELETKLEELSIKSAGGSSVEEELNSIKQELESEREKNRRITVKSEITEAIKSREKQAQNLEDVLMYLGDEVYSLEKDEEGKFVGLDDKLAQLETDRPHWFIEPEVKPKGTGGFLGNTGGGKKDTPNYGKQIGQSQKKETVDTSAYEI